MRGQGGNLIKFSDAEIVTMRERLIRGDNAQDICDDYNTSREYIRQIKHNRIRKGIGPDASKSKQARKPSVRAAERKARAVELAKSGKNAREISEILGISYGWAWVCATGFLSYRRLSVEDEARVRQLYREGYVQTEIAKMFGVSQILISKKVRGIKRGSAKEQ